MMRKLLMAAAVLLVIAAMVAVLRRGASEGGGDALVHARDALEQARAGLDVRPAAAAQKVRPPAVAGSFYPRDAGALRAAVEAYLQDARPPRQDAPRALVAPHAGYVFSGQIAADSWNQVRDAHPDVIVILGTNHTQPAFEGVSVYDGVAYRTPLGEARLDRKLIERLRASDSIFTFKEKVHEREHSVEVQVPFAQVLFPGVPLVCAVVGKPEVELCRRAGHALATVLKDRHPLIVASSDLSHYPDRQTAIEADRFTLERLVRLDPTGFLDAVRRRERKGGHGLVTCACGKAPIMTMMVAVEELGAKDARVVSYANSGESSLGEAERCVGYGAVAVWPGAARADATVLRGLAEVASGPPAWDDSAPRWKEIPRSQNEESDAPLAPQARQWLLRFARKTLRQYLTTQTAPLARDLPPQLLRHQGAFVTLTTKGHRLRGCIGHIPADSPLAVVVGQMAIQAATQDPRFPPVQADELDGIEIEISALSPPREVAGPEEIVLGRDGIILRKGGYAAVYLPQVAPEQGWNLEQTLSHLSRKAGLPSDGWKHGARFETFQAEVFSE